MRYSAVWLKYYLLLSSLLVYFASCRQESDYINAAEDYCECYSMYRSQFDYNDTFIVNKCVDTLREFYPMIDIRYEILLNPSLAGNKYSYELLDSARIYFEKLNNYKKNLCPNAPAL